MNNSQYNQLFSFIWNIANDVLVHAFEKGEYKKIIMPMMVLRRLDVLLEPTKDKVLERKAMLDKNHITNQEQLLFMETGYPFYNTSKFTMKTLKSEIDPTRLKMNFIEYWGYITQLAIYQKVVELNTGEKLPCFICAIDKTESPAIEIIQIPNDRMAWELSLVEYDVKHALELKSGEIEPIRCGKCSYCKETKVLTSPIVLDELTGRM